MIMAVCGLIPTLITLVIAVVADPDNPASAGRWNMLEPRGDDTLFVGIAGMNRGPLDAIGPLSFLVLIAVMALLSFLGILGAESPSSATARVIGQSDDRER